MKVGILTFHWATNYGAVLQTYALQHYLVKLGHQVEVINYMPSQYSKTLFKCINVKSVTNTIHKYNMLRKEYKINRFRTKYLQLSNISYSSYEDLKTKPPCCDVYIVGSDQVWNQYFTSKGEGKLTLSYFLDFGLPKVKRIAYAVSFGCTEYPDALSSHFKPVLDKFCAISVRENTGRTILKKMGYGNVEVLPDPTLLLQSCEYDRFIDAGRPAANSIAVYLVNTKFDKSLRYAIEKVGRCLNCKIIYISGQHNTIYGIEDWLTIIKTSKYVVTDSYHGIVFAIKYNKPFAALPVQGSGIGMNDRVFTLFSELNIERNIDNNLCIDFNYILDSLNANLNWRIINSLVDGMCFNARNYLLNHI